MKNVKFMVTIKTSSKSNFRKFKKGISPVVATALLLVVAVVAAVGFQAWFQTFSSSVFVDVEQQSISSNSDGGIETLIGNKLYINAGDNLTISRLMIDGNECLNGVGNYSGIQDINVSDCLNSTSTNSPEIVIISNDVVFSKYVYIKDDVVVSSVEGLEIVPIVPLDCSGLDGGEWISVLGNGLLGTNDFCVMKYEAKDVGGIPTSQSGNDPWVSINQTDAVLECDSLNNGTGNYHLITDPEWVTVARLAENDNTNWNSSIVGTGVMARGWAAHTSYGDTWSNSLIAPSSGLSCLYNIGANTCGATGEFLYKRTLNISGSLIWDLGGNVREWTNDTLNTFGAQNSSLGTGSSDWHEWDIISEYSYLKPSDGTLNSSNGIGNVLTEINGAFPSGDVHALIRGERFDYGLKAGVFALRLDVDHSFSTSSTGFRCSYTQ